MSTQTWNTRVSEYMRQHHMAERGEGILAAVSGGADSVCLLLVLHALSESLGIHIAAFHLNHGLRGKEADRDEAYVAELCERLNIPLKVAHENVAEYAKAHRLSEEEAGRVLRYRHLTAAAKELSCSKIATAHHKDDQVETVLMNLFRGSGLRGLGGIRPVRRLAMPTISGPGVHEAKQSGNSPDARASKQSIINPASRAEEYATIIRPLLCMTRQEIEAYLIEESTSWCEDITNRELIYARNKVRNVLMPWLRENINDRADEHILQTAAFAAQADEYFVAQAEKILDEAGKSIGQPEFCGGGFFAMKCAQNISVTIQEEKQNGHMQEEVKKTTMEIPVNVFDTQPEILKSYLVRAMIARLTGSAKDISVRHIEAVCALRGPGGGTQVDLPYELQAVRGYQTLTIRTAHRPKVTTAGEPVREPDGGPESRPESKPTGEPVKEPESKSAGEPVKEPEGRPESKPDSAPEHAKQSIDGVQMENSLKMRVFSRKKEGEIPKNQYTKWFDYDKIKGTLSVRTRENGDYITISNGKTKKLNRFFIDEKIPEAQRDKILLLAEGKHILWIVGYRISEHYKISDKTQTILEVWADKGEKHG